MTTEQTPSRYQVGGTHYTELDIQPWDAMQAWMTQEQFLGFLLGNGIKYLARCNSKGSRLTDLKKARHYIEKAIQTIESDNE